MKFFLFNLIFIAVTYVAFAQEEESTTILKFDKDKYESLKSLKEIEKQDSTMIFLDSIPLFEQQVDRESGMKVYSPTGKMAPMPQMEINDDINYTMLKKGYSNAYPYKPKPSSDSLKIKMGKPLIKKENKE